MITVVHKGKEPNNFYCGRGTPLGNPFRMTDEWGRDAVCDAYQAWFYTKINEPMFLDTVDQGISTERLNPETNQLIRIYKEALQGDVNLGCFCAPKRCHCDTIKNFIENKLEESLK